ncbi:MAG: hypothetical protein ACFCU8_14490 [Thermosynechococcaceae cyanobacterium]
MIQSDKLIGIIEAKIDLGYLSTTWAQARHQLIDDLIAVGKVANRGRELTVSNSLRLSTVILTEHNGRGKQKESLEPANPITLLSKEHKHPGDDTIEKESFMKQIKKDPERQEWQRLHKFITDLGSWIK